MKRAQELREELSGIITAACLIIRDIIEAIEVSEEQDVDYLELHTSPVYGIPVDPQMTQVIARIYKDKVWIDDNGSGYTVPLGELTTDDLLYIAEELEDGSYDIEYK